MDDSATPTPGDTPDGSGIDLRDAEAWLGEPDPSSPAATTADGADGGDGLAVPASTGGTVHLERILGRIPIVLVFLDDPHAEPAREALRSLGERLADLGRDRVQVLAVAPSDQADVVRLDDRTEGNVRILADDDGAVAGRFRSGDGTDVVLIGADGSVSAQWQLQLDGTIADGIMERLGAQL